MSADLVLEILRRIQTDVAQLNEGQKDLRIEIGAIGQQLGALTTAVAIFDAAAWDAQIEADAAAGKFDALAEEALAEYHSGKAREI